VIARLGTLLKVLSTLPRLRMKFKTKLLGIPVIRHF
jgi:hypothetical protein